MLIYFHPIQTNGIFKLHHTHKHTKKSKTTHKQPCISTAVEPRRTALVPMEILLPSIGHTTNHHRRYHRPKDDTHEAPSSILRSSAAMIVCASTINISLAAATNDATNLLPSIGTYHDRMYHRPNDGEASSFSIFHRRFFAIRSSAATMIVCSTSPPIADGWCELLWDGWRSTINDRYVSITKWYDNAYAIVTNVPFILYSATAHELTTSAEWQK